MSEGGVITLALTVASAIVWAVRVEGIVRAHEQQLAQIRQEMEGKIDILLEEMRYVRKRVDEWGKRP